MSERSRGRGDVEEDRDEREDGDPFRDRFEVLQLFRDTARLVDMHRTIRSAS